MNWYDDFIRGGDDSYLVVVFVLLLLIADDSCCYTGVGLFLFLFLFFGFLVGPPFHFDFDPSFHKQGLWTVHWVVDGHPFEFPYEIFMLFLNAFDLKTVWLHRIFLLLQNIDLRFVSRKFIFHGHVLFAHHSIIYVPIYTLTLPRPFLLLIQPPPQPPLPSIPAHLSSPSNSHLDRRLLARGGSRW